MNKILCLAIFAIGMLIVPSGAYAASTNYTINPDIHGDVEYRTLMNGTSITITTTVANKSTGEALESLATVNVSFYNASNLSDGLDVTGDGTDDVNVTLSWSSTNNNYRGVFNLSFTTNHYALVKIQVGSYKKDVVDAKYMMLKDHYFEMSSLYEGASPSTYTAGSNTLTATTFLHKPDGKTYSMSYNSSKQIGDDWYKVDSYNSNYDKATMMVFRPTSFPATPKDQMVSKLSSNNNLLSALGAAGDGGIYEVVLGDTPDFVGDANRAYAQDYVVKIAGTGWLRDDYYIIPSQSAADFWESPQVWDSNMLDPFNPSWQEQGDHADMDFNVVKQLKLFGFVLSEKKIAEGDTWGNVLSWGDGFSLATKNAKNYYWMDEVAAGTTSFEIGEVLTELEVPAGFLDPEVIVKSGDGIPTLGTKLAGGPLMGTDLDWDNIFTEIDGLALEAE